MIIKSKKFTNVRKPDDVTLVTKPGRYIVEPRTNRVIKYLTEDEVENLLAAITSVRDKAIFTVAYYHGLRASEVGMISLDDYDYKESKLLITRAKFGVGNWQSLTKLEIRLLNTWILERSYTPYDSDALFVTRNDRPISTSMLDVLMKRYCMLVRPAIPKELHHFHTLRHSCAVSMVTAGVPHLQIKNWLGHKALASTLIYAQVDTIALDSAFERMNQYRSKKIKDKKIIG